MSYIVKAHNLQNQEQMFEGPLDLLLDLIEKEKLDITDIALAQVADQFIGYLENSKEDITPEYLSSFILVAGKLILIKSKAILPMLELEKEEEEDIEELKSRLREYQRFKNISKEIKLLEKRSEMFYSRQSYSGMKNIFSPPEDISCIDLQSSLENIFIKMPQIDTTRKMVIINNINIKDKIQYIKDRMMHRIEMTFKDMTVDASDKIEIIITFLAMLELVRKSLVVVEQADMFGDIKIKRI
ncbi:segregation/condensation protein A [Patescibacteria group bacterium]|nr:segregation/condensation protein A [Patescibacteria group bacterium]